MWVCGLCWNPLDTAIGWFISCPALWKNVICFTWRSSLGQPPGWARGKCRWWSAAPCGAAASRGGWSRRRGAAGTSSACRGGRGGRRAACSPERGAQRSKSTTERERFTGERSQGGYSFQWQWIKKKVMNTHKWECTPVHQRIFPSRNSCWE